MFTQDKNFNNYKIAVTNVCPVVKFLVNNFVFFFTE